MTLLTLGYQLRTIHTFLDEATAAGVRVILDVRDSPQSRKPGFSGSGLARACEARGLRYVHAPFAGNPRHLRQAAASHKDSLTAYAAHLAANPKILEDFSALVTPLLEAGESPCLVCYERHPDDCHRSVLARAWAATSGARVVHLSPDGAPRLMAGRVELGPFGFGEAPVD